MKFLKAKPSGHFLENLRTRDDRKEITPEVAEEVIRDATVVNVQDNGRFKYAGQSSTLGYPLYVVVSAAVSAGNTIGRLVTAYKSRALKKLIRPTSGDAED